MVYAEQVYLLYKPFLLSVTATFFAAILFVAAQWQVIEHDILLGWLLAITIVTLARSLLAYLYKRAKPDIDESRRWGRLFIFGTAIAGATWGIGSILFFPEDNVTHQMLVIFVLIGMCSGAVTSLSAVRTALFVFLATAMLPVLPMFLMEQTYLTNVITPMIMLAFIFFIKGANNIYYNTQKNIYLRIDAEEKEKALIQAKEAAEKANRAKSDFLSRMSHELRTPMNAILGFAQILKMDDKDFNETQRGNVQEILDAGQHLTYLINDVLDLAKIESGKLDVSMEEVHLDDLLDQTLNLVTPEAEARHIKIINQISDNHYIVMADFTRLKQVLLNLLSNAIKYNHEQGSITLENEITETQNLRISITDTGSGLSENDISRLFTPFERLNAANNVEGTGIGLVITKYLIELMGGNIGVRSKAGEGSCFWLELKLAEKLTDDIKEADIE